MCFKTYFCYQKLAKYGVKHNKLLQKHVILVEGNDKNGKNHAKLSKTQQEPEKFPTPVALFLLLFGADL